MASVLGREDFTSSDYLAWAKDNALTAATAINKMFEMFNDRARQNVVLEFGYFMGRLSRERICCLYKGDIELPSAIQGICYVHFSDSVNEVKEIILKELREAGYEIEG